MFTYLKYLLRNSYQQFTGGLLDTRPENQKKEDIHFSEIVAKANPVLWREKTESELRKFPKLDQKNSYTCGANAITKYLGILLKENYGTYVQFNRPFVYQNRLNRPSAGMSMYDMFRIAEIGIPIEAVINSPLLTESDYETVKIEPWMKKEGETWKTGQGIYLSNNIDEIASVIQTTKKGVVLLTYFLAGEWSKDFPYIVNPNLSRLDSPVLAHFVVATDYYLKSGIKHLYVEDSAGFGGLFARSISEDWVKNRIIGAGYTMNFKFMIGEGSKPSYDSVTITSAQECLRYEGLFPTNISFVENVGPVTRESLAKFQIKYGLTITRQIDQNTQSKLRELYP